MSTLLHSPVPRPRRLSFRMWDGAGTLLLNLFVWALVIAYLFPMSYMMVTAVKDGSQFTDSGAPLWPAQAVTYTYLGKEYDIYKVPTAQGVRQWALVSPHREDSDFVDPQNPDAGLINWPGRWRTLEKVYQLHLVFDSFANIWTVVDFPRLLQNTAIVAGLGEIAVLISSILVAYGFARFPIPYEKVLFAILLATIIIPEKITLIPTYFIFVRVLHWDGTWLPLLAPQLFGNAILIFLLRQNFKSIPREMEEAAMLDGAGPVRTLLSVVLPQCIPVLVTVSLLHFFYAWNETRLQALYLSTNPDLFTVAYAVQNYGSYFPAPSMLQVSALLVMSVPVLVLFLAQRLFMQNIVITGVEKPGRRMRGKEDR
ncbi:MAG: carbohydrate ABC transporter permease [Anaerolineae bacterium]